MLEKDFYKIIKSSKDTNQFNVSIELNPSHPIYEGHFPGQPVVPGACLLQITKELSENIAGAPVQLVKADELKFLKPVVPGEPGNLEFSIQYSFGELGNALVIGMMKKNGEICFKFKILFKQIISKTEG